MNFSLKIMSVHDKWIMIPILTICFMGFKSKHDSVSQVNSLSLITYIPNTTSILMTLMTHLSNTWLTQTFWNFIQASRWLRWSILWHRCWTRGVAVWYIVHVTVHTRIFLLSVNTIVRLKSCRETFRPLTRNTIMLLAILQIQRSYAADERIARVTVSQ